MKEHLYFIVYDGLESKARVCLLILGFSPQNDDTMDTLSKLVDRIWKYLTERIHWCHFGW